MTAQGGVFMVVSVQSGQVMSTPVDYLPLRLRKYFLTVESQMIYEIRLRRQKPLCVIGPLGTRYLSASGRLTEDSSKGVLITSRDIEEALDMLTSYSLYSFKNEIKNGYITTFGGHRVGICGTVTQDEEFITDVSCLNFRFAREVIGAADLCVEDIYNNGQVKNTLIVSGPGGGKTTFLRDLIRQISDKNINVSVVDERGEISNMHQGVAGFDLGMCTDVMNMCSKQTGMKLVLRSMMPGVIAVDELDILEDARIITTCASSGVSVFATLHTGDWKREIPKEILSKFRCIVVLSNRRGPGTVEEIVHV